MNKLLPNERFGAYFSRKQISREAIFFTNDEYRTPLPLSPPKRPITEKNLKVFDQQIHQKLATDVIGVSFDAQ